MDTNTIKEKLNLVFRDVFGDDNLNVNETMTAADVPGWDSLAHINLIVAVERAFAISLTTRDVRAMKNVGDMIELVSKRRPNGADFHVSFTLSRRCPNLKGVTERFGNDVRKIMGDE